MSDYQAVAAAERTSARNPHWLRGWRLVGLRRSVASIRAVSCGTLKSLGEPRRIDWTSEDSEWAPCADVAILQPFKACADGKLHDVGRQIAGVPISTSVLREPLQLPSSYK